MAVPGGHSVTMRQAENKLNKMNSYLSVGMDNCLLTAQDIESTNAFEKEEHTDKLSEIKGVMIEFINLEQEVKDFTEALQQTATETEVDEDGDVNIEELFMKKLKEVQEEARSKDPKNHPKFQELLEQEMNDEDGAESGDDDNEDIVATDTETDDEDVAMTHADVNIKCPITKKDMVHPMRNKHCNHRYEREGIISHIKTSKGRARCPIGGCQANFITEKDLIEDVEFKKVIRKRKREEKKK